eukprot:422845-Pleurochrysis_carterae.AAC.1
MPTAYATSGRVCVEQYRRAPTSDWYSFCSAVEVALSDLDARADSTCFGKSSEAGACERWWRAGTPAGISETGPSSSTFHLPDKASVKRAYKESRPSSECRMKRSSNRTAVAKGRAYVATGDLPAPCRTRASPLDRCEGGRRRRRSRTLAVHDNIPPRRLAVRLVSRRPRNPSDACACRCLPRSTPRLAGTWDA